MKRGVRKEKRKRGRTKGIFKKEFALVNEQYMNVERERDRGDEEEVKRGHPKEGGRGVRDSTAHWTGSEGYSFRSHCLQSLHFLCNEPGLALLKRVCLFLPDC